MPAKPKDPQAPAALPATLDITPLDIALAKARAYLRTSNYRYATDGVMIRDGWTGITDSHSLFAALNRADAGLPPSIIDAASVAKLKCAPTKTIAIRYVADTAAIPDASIDGPFAQASNPPPMANIVADHRIDAVIAVVPDTLLRFAKALQLLRGNGVVNLCFTRGGGPIRCAFMTTTGETVRALLMPAIPDGHSHDSSFRIASLNWPSMTPAAPSKPAGPETAAE